MTEGISKERLIEIKQSLPYGQARLNLDRLIKAECKELDPWLPIDENTPRNQDLLITDKSKRKYIGRLFSSGIWCTQGKLDFSPTQYKLLQEDPK